MEFNRIEEIAYNKGYRIGLEGQVLNSKGKELKPILYGRYYKFNIKLEGKSTRIKIHRLQAYQKFGDKIYEEGIEVRHLDCNGFNNSWDNIEIGTHSDNMLDIPQEIRVKNATSANKKYSDELAKEIQEFHSIDRSYKLTMEKYSISSKGSLSLLLKRKL